jgi:hypothetical protein
MDFDVWIVADTFSFFAACYAGKLQNKVMAAKAERIIFACRDCTLM